MSYLKWDQSLSVNDDVMDEQHQLLFDYVNEFYEAIKKHEDNHQLLQIMEKVLAYTKFHCLSPLVETMHFSARL